jgi:hypothetical protein
MNRPDSLRPGEEAQRSRVDVQRSMLVLAACEGLMKTGLPNIGGQVQVKMRPQGTIRWQTSMLASDSPMGIEAVARRDADLAIVNPSAVLTLAYRGRGRYRSPIPVRIVTVMPQRDHLALAVNANSGLKYLEDVAEQHYPLKVSLRGERTDHSVHMVVNDVLEAAGCPLHKIQEWGGSVDYDPGIGDQMVHSGQPTRIERVRNGSRDAVFDEAFYTWVHDALDSDMQFLSLREGTLNRLCADGYRRSVVPKQDHNGLQDDVITIDFSGWAVFTHAETPDAAVRAFCIGIEQNKHRIPWEAEGLERGAGMGPFPLERLCLGPEDAPFDVPFHPAAEHFWSECGYL